MTLLYVAGTLNTAESIALQDLFTQEVEINWNRDHKKTDSNNEYLDFGVMSGRIIIDWLRGHHNPSPSFILNAALMMHPRIMNDLKNFVDVFPEYLIAERVTNFRDLTSEFEL